VGREVVCGSSDQVTAVNNDTGGAALPFNVFPGSTSRYDESGSTPVIYVKYYFGASTSDRIFADTLIYIGPR